MARREALRLLAGSRSQPGLILLLLGAVLLSLLIPLHRAYGGSPGRSSAPYFLLFAVGIQIGLTVLSARAVWAGMRTDMATGSTEELLLTGARVPQLLLSKWLGTCAAAAVGALALLPLTLLAAAFTGAPMGAVAPVVLCWAVSAALGALVGTLLALSERAPLASTAAVMGFIQFWFLFRWIIPRVGAGPVWADLMRWTQYLDPLTLVPAAVGAVREPWLLKVAVLVMGMAVAVVWMLGSDAELPLRNQRHTTKDPSDFFSLRPVRAWLTGQRTERAPEYDREVMYPFERAYGWRLRVSPPAWMCLLALGNLPALPLAILGRDAHLAAVILALPEAGVAAVIGAMGIAAGLAAEREQGRWIFLLCSPLSAREIIRAKWRAAWLESWPLWLAAALRGGLMAAAGALPWEALPVIVLAAPVAAGVSAAVVGALCVRAPSLTTAQQRAALWLLAPPLTALGTGFLLPRLPGIGYISLPHVLFSALQFRPGFADPPHALLALLAYGALGAVALGLAIVQLRHVDE
ncbi:MAG TPA: hypothetical protein VK689_13885 [Armatimonadota bacterium]|nr:hypothetical protein [Armatimonadota bacterium]